MSQVSELLSAQEKLSKQMEEMRVGLSSKDADILHLKMKNQQLSTEGPGDAETLRVENPELKIKVSTLTWEVQVLNAEVKDLINQLLRVQRWKCCSSISPPDLHLPKTPIFIVCWNPMLVSFVVSSRFIGLRNLC